MNLFELIKNIPAEFWHDVLAVVVSVTCSITISTIITNKIILPRLIKLEKDRKKISKLLLNKRDLVVLENNIFKKLK